MNELVDGLTTWLGQTAPQWTWTYRHVPALVFAFCFGACVGSFINVVAYRMPRGISIISPPSRCPTCGAKLNWRQNFPILGWLFLRGRCHYCGARISSQYMLIELFVALLFTGLTIRFYVIAAAAPWDGGIYGPWWRYNGIWTLPAFIAILVLFSSLVAMTLIDAKTFTIPIEIPIVATVTAFACYGLQAILQGALPYVAARGGQAWPIPIVGWTGFGAAAGGMLGLAMSLALLRAGKLRRSFADYEEYLPAPPKESPVAAEEEGGWLNELTFRIAFWIPPIAAAWVASLYTTDPFVIGFAGGGGLLISSAAGWLIRRGAPADDDEPAPVAALAPDYPHARREVLVELLYLTPCIILLVAGALVGYWLGSGADAPHFWSAMGGSMLGYIVGGGVVWGVRILGTLCFGREAMGQGDVHLLAAVGAALGWRDPILIFFAAAFVGLAWALPSLVMRHLRHELPYGPHLAVATLLVLLAHPVIYPWLCARIGPWIGCP